MGCQLGTEKGVITKGFGLFAGEISRISSLDSRKSLEIISNGFPQSGALKISHVYGISRISEKLGIRKGGGGKTYRAILGGESVPQSTPSKTSFGGLRKWDLSGLCPFPLRRMTLRKQRGGEIVS